MNENAIQSYIVKLSQNALYGVTDHLKPGAVPGCLLRRGKMSRYCCASPKMLRHCLKLNQSKLSLEEKVHAVKAQLTTLPKIDGNININLAFD